MGGQKEQSGAMMTLIHKLLLATDFSEWAQRAEEYACSLAALWHAHLTVMTVLEFPPGMNPDYPVNKNYLTERTAQATEQFEEFKRRASKRGIVVATHLATGMPSEEVTAAARAEGADLLVVGTKGKSGLAHVLLGSTAERVIRTAPCPVLAVHMPSGEKAMVNQTVGSIRRLLVPIDFSDCSLDALEYAAIVAKQGHATIELLHVLEPVSYGLDFTLIHPEAGEQNRKRLTARLEQLSSALSGSGVPTKVHVRGGSPADSILHDMRTLSCDMIVMGTHGRRGLSHVMAGSVAEAVLRRASCPVLTVRSPKFSPGHQRVVSISNEQAVNP